MAVAEGSVNKDLNILDIEDSCHCIFSPPITLSLSFLYSGRMSEQCGGFKEYLVDNGLKKPSRGFFENSSSIVEDETGDRWLGSGFITFVLDEPIEDILDEGRFATSGFTEYPEYPRTLCIPPKERFVFPDPFKSGSLRLINIPLTTLHLFKA